MKQFDLTYYYGPDESLVERDDVWRDMRDAGITLARISYTTLEKNRAALLQCERYGIRANVYDVRFPRAMRADAAECDRLIGECVRDYTPFSAVVGFDIEDEPCCADFAGLGRMVAALERYAPGYEVVINLFPNYAMPEQLGCATYGEHVRRFVEEVKPPMLSYDHYHFLEADADAPTDADLGNVEANLVFENAFCSRERAGFFENADIIRDEARRVGIDSMMIALLVQHGPYRNLTREELSYEASVCLAYGFRRMSYFTYGLPKGDDGFWHWQHAMIDNEGERDAHYYDVQAISRWLVPLGRHLFELDCERVVHTDCEKLTHGRIRSVSGATVAGCYSDGSVLLASKSPSHETSLVIEGEDLERYLPECERFVAVEGAITLSAGECALVR